MTELFTVVAVALMVLAVIGSIVPLLPGALLSILGILIYWWGTGYQSPGPVFLVAFIVVGLFAVLTDYFAGAFAAKAGGASTTTSLVAAVVGLVLFFVAGPIGIIAGVAGTVFVLEYVAGSTGDRSLHAALYAAIGVLGSAAIQLVVTVTLLIAFVIALFLP